MKFKKFILEETKLDKNLIKNIIQEIEKQNLENEPVLYRGMNGISDDIGIKKIRKDREPSSVNITISKMIDSLFYDNYKIKPRSQGLFVTRFSPSTKIYGHTYIIIPKGKVEYVYSNEIGDLMLNSSFKLQSLKISNEEVSYLNDLISNKKKSNYYGSTSCLRYTLSNLVDLLGSEEFENDKVIRNIIKVNFIDKYIISKDYKKSDNNVEIVLIGDDYYFIDCDIFTKKDTIVYYKDVINELETML